MTQLMLQSAFQDLDNTRNRKVDVYSVSPIDPIGICDFSLKIDLLNPYHLADNNSIGIDRPELTNDIPISVINTCVDRDVLLAPLMDFEQRSRYGNSPFYLNPRQNDLPNLGQNSWGLGLNEALNRAHGDHVVIATPPVVSLLEDLGVRHITGPTTLPFNWLAISVPQKDLT